jgi:DNA polymerase-3 subunit delta'
VFYKKVLMSEVKPHGLAINKSHMSKARELWNFKQLSAKIEAVDYAEAALNRNCNKGLVCEVLMLNLFQR